MAIQDLQKRIDRLYEKTFGQIEAKGGRKPKSQATRRLRRTLGGRPLECTVRASQISQSLLKQYHQQGIQIGDNVEAKFKDFGQAVVQGFKNDRRLKGPKGLYEYRGGQVQVTEIQKDFVTFIISGFKRNDISFLRFNKKVSQDIMDRPEFAELFVGEEASKVMEVAHAKGYGIVEAKGSLLKAEAKSAQTMKSQGGIQPSKIGKIGDKLKNLATFQSTLLLEGEHDMDVRMDGGKVVSTTTFRAGVEAKHQNRLDAVEQSRLGTDLKLLLDDVRAEITKEYNNPANTVEERNSRPITDIIGDMIVMTPTKRRLYSAGIGVNKSTYTKVPKGKSPTKAKKQGTITQKRQRIAHAGPDSTNVVPTSKGQEKGEGTGKEDFAMQMRHLLKVKNAINKRLPAAVRANMARPALINRTGRFSNSVNVESIIPAAQTLMVRYNYRLNPYETFENKGKRRWPTGYNPKPLISKSIRELALGLVAQKLTIRRS
jgi:hypothetical protein